MGDALEFGANDVGGEARGQEAAIKRSELALVDLAANVGKPALEACADERGFVSLRENGIEGGFDVAVGDAAAAKIASDAITSLTAQPGVVTCELEGVTRVVEIIQLTQARDHGGDQVFVFSVALEVLLHLVDRMRAAHQSTLRGHFELMLGSELAAVRAEGHGEI